MAVSNNTNEKSPSLVSEKSCLSKTHCTAFESEEWSEKNSLICNEKKPFICQKVFVDESELNDHNFTQHQGKDTPVNSDSGSNVVPDNVVNVIPEEYRDTSVDAVRNVVTSDGGNKSARGPRENTAASQEKHGKKSSIVKSFKITLIPDGKEPVPMLLKPPNAFEKQTEDSKEKGTLVYERLKNKKCNLCDEIFGNETDLYQHLVRKHLQRKRCVCVTCRLRFENQNEMIQHVMSKHCDKITLKCNICNEAYPTEGVLNHHMINKHSAAVTFICEDRSDSIPHISQSNNPSNYPKRKREVLNTPINAADTSKVPNIVPLGHGHQRQLTQRCNHRSACAKDLEAQSRDENIPMNMDNIANVVNIVPIEYENEGIDNGENAVNTGLPEHENDSSYNAANLSHTLTHESAPVHSDMMPRQMAQMQEEKTVTKTESEPQMQHNVTPSNVIRNTRFKIILIPDGKLVPRTNTITHKGNQLGETAENEDFHNKLYSNPEHSVIPSQEQNWTDNLVPVCEGPETKKKKTSYDEAFQTEIRLHQCEMCHKIFKNLKARTEHNLAEHMDENKGVNSDQVFDKMCLSFIKNKNETGGTWATWDSIKMKLNN